MGALACLIVPVGAIAEPLLLGAFDPDGSHPIRVAMATSGAIELACGIVGAAIVIGLEIQRRRRRSRATQTPLSQPDTASPAAAATQNPTSSTPA